LTTRLACTFPRLAPPSQLSKLLAAAMSAEKMDVDGMEDVAPSDHTDQSDASGSESEPEAPAELMVKTRERRANAGNRMSTLLAKSAEEEEEWGEEWEEAPNEEEFQGGDFNEQDDYNMDSSSSEEGDDESML
jgi:vacuolar protein sorting-associated protein 72